MQTLSITDMYMSVLSNLSNDDKLDLIAKLTRSMHSKSKIKAKKIDLHTCFSGDWDKNKTSSQIADELRKNRYYNSQHKAF